MLTSCLKYFHMLISFKTKKLQKTCSQQREMQKQLGPAMARKLQQRLMELQAADTLADISHLPPPRCHELGGNRTGQFSVDLVHPYRLLFIPAENPVPTREDGGVDLNLVVAVQIIEIEDTH
jgi:proteic killer suppression protein